MVKPDALVTEQRAKGAIRRERILRVVRYVREALSSGLKYEHVLGV
jgi:hypothetical protein